MTKRTRKSNRGRQPKTFGELVTWAFDVMPSSGSAVELLDQLFQKRKVRFAGRAKI